jgi:hypothetical protein
MSSKIEISNFNKNDHHYIVIGVMQEYDKQTWIKVTDFCAECNMDTIFIDIGDGVILDSHPEIAVEGAWTKDEFKAELERLRSKGLNPLPKFNFSSAHSAWMGKYAYMVGTQIYYDFCRDVIEEVCDIFGSPEIFHIGMEEEDANSQKNKPIAIVRAPHIMMRDINFLADVCKAKGARACIWLNDKMIEAFGGEDAFCKNISKDIIMMPYYYGWVRPYYTEAEIPKTVKLMKRLGELGYDMIVCSSTWSWHLAMHDVMDYCKNNVDNKHILGYIMASWILTDPKKYNALLDAAYNYKYAKATVFGE